MDNNAFEITGLTKNYSPGRIALDGITLRIPQGCVSAVIGRNGAGKSTLFGCIAGLLGFEAGRVLIFAGDSCSELTPEGNGIRRAFRQRIGIVFQEPSLWPHLTVLQNVMTPLVDIFEYDEQEAERRAKNWLVDKLKLAEKKINLYPRQLSGGEQRRVALARTFVINPDILLIDEIEASLDPEAVETVLRLVENNFARDPSKTVLMVTHRIDFLARNASRVIVLDKGRVIEEGPPEKILWNPDPQTASFIREVIDPSRSHWNLSYRCLESAIRITSLALKRGSATGSAIFQELTHQVTELISQLEPDSPHLVLMVTRHADEPSKLSIRGACRNPGFILNGEDVQSLGALVEPEIEHKEGDLKRIDQYRFADGYERMLHDPSGVMFEVGDELSGSLIAMMFKSKRKLEYLYAETYTAISGPYHVPIPPREPVDKASYYQFSEGTCNVYLFPMEWNGKTVGVLSIDTYSSEKWLPFVVKQLLLIANLGALAIKIDEGRLEAGAK